MLFRNKREKTPDHSEANAALQRSQEAKDRVKSRQGIVTSVSSAVRVAREKNHIADGMHHILYGGR